MRKRALITGCTGFTGIYLKEKLKKNFEVFGTTLEKSKTNDNTFLADIADKEKLRNLIHKDNAILKKVERIVHPLLEHSKVEFIKSNADLPLIVFDIPLLFEKQQERNFDAVLVVTASELTQKKRVLSRKNMKEQDFQLIKRNQMSEQEKIKRADFLINTDKSLLETEQDVQKICKKIKGSLV